MPLSSYLLNDGDIRKNAKPQVLTLGLALYFKFNSESQVKYIIFLHPQQSRITQIHFNLLYAVEPQSTHPTAYVKRKLLLKYQLHLVHLQPI